MEKLNREESIDSIKKYILYKMKVKGLETKGISNSWLTEKATEIYENRGEGDEIMRLVPEGED